MAIIKSLEEKLRKVENLYRSLVDQLDRLARHNRQGSYKTRKRYYEAMKRFCWYLAAEWHLGKLKNISGKHLDAYARYMQDCGKAPSTILTDLSAIRFWHDKMDAKYPLPANHEMDTMLKRRESGKVDRTWSKTEVERFRTLCLENGREGYAEVTQLCYRLGLRIHEAFRLDRAAAEAAVRTGQLPVKGKNGKERMVPVEEAERKLLRRRMAVTRRGHKLFVQDGIMTDQTIEQAQKFLLAVRREVRDPGSTSPLTFHGLRHNYAVEQYLRTRDALLASGMSEGAADREARQKVSILLGHERIEITRIYLASLKRKEEGEAAEEETL